MLFRSIQGVVGYIKSMELHRKSAAADIRSGTEMSWNGRTPATSGRICKCEKRRFQHISSDDMCCLFCDNIDLQHDIHGAGMPIGFV